MFDKYIEDLIKMQMEETGYEYDKQAWRATELRASTRQAFTIVATLCIIFVLTIAALVGKIYIQDNHVTSPVTVVTPVIVTNIVPELNVTAVDINTEYNVTIPQWLLKKVNAREVITSTIIKQRVLGNQLVNIDFLIPTSVLAVGDVCVDKDDLTIYVGKDLSVKAHNNSIKVIPTVGVCSKLEEVVSYTEVIHQIGKPYHSELYRKYKVRKGDVTKLYERHVVYLITRLKKLDVPVNKLTVNLINELGVSNFGKLIRGTLPASKLKRLLPKGTVANRGNLITHWAKLVK